MSRNKDASITYVSNGLRLFMPRSPGMQHLMFISDEESSYEQKMTVFLESKLQVKKAMSGSEIYCIAMKPNGDHWSAGFLLLRTNKPRLFIIDSIAQYAPSALDVLSSCMQKYGGHTYLCESGLQKDDENCATFTLDFLLALSKHENFFYYLNALRQRNEMRESCVVTKIDPMDLPPEIVRNAQSLKFLESYIEKHPETKKVLEDYISDNAGEFRGKKINNGIVNTKKTFYTMIDASSSPCRPDALCNLLVKASYKAMLN